MIRMLIADDNAAITRILAGFARRDGCEVTTVADGEAVLRAFHSRPYDILLLDVMMPKKDGFAVCRELRSESDIPIIMITARSEDYDRIMGLDIGADDYIVKPFSAAEVMARVRAVLRRLERTTAEAGAEALCCGSLCVDSAASRAYIAGQPLPLTRKEFDLLCLLLENKGRVFSRDHLLDRLWGADYYGDTRTVDSHIKRLRAKLDAIPHAGWQIKTIWGVGYMFEVMP